MALKGTKGPGFFAADIGTLLKQRSDWLEGLGENTLLRSEDLSSNSSEWDGEREDHIHDDEQPTDKAEAESVKKPPDPAAPIDESPLCFAATQKLFSDVPLEPDFEDDPDTVCRWAGRGATQRRSSVSSTFTRTSTGLASRNEPPNRRLHRVRAEVDAFCAWAQGHKQAMEAAPAGESELAREASMLATNLRSVAGMVQRAVASNQVANPEVSSKVVWLPPQERDNVNMVQHLLEYNRLAHGHGHEALQSGEKGLNHHQQVSYKFSATMGQKGGWLAAAENEALAELETRIQQIGRVLGKRSGGGGGSGAGQGAEAEGRSLAGTMTHLHRRLETLHHVQDDAACDRLKSSIRLLSADIDMAIAEAKHLEAVEAELSSDIHEEESLQQQVTRLHERVSGADAVAARVAEIERQFAAQEQTHDELTHFARDLAGAEAQAQHASELLQAAAEAAQEMKKAAEANKTQLEANVKALERRLKEWQASAAAASSASAEPPPGAGSSAAAGSAAGGTKS